MMLPSAAGNYCARASSTAFKGCCFFTSFLSALVGGEGVSVSECIAPALVGGVCERSESCSWPAMQMPELCSPVKVICRWPFSLCDDAAGFDLVTNWPAGESMHKAQGKLWHGLDTMPAQWKVQCSLIIILLFSPIHVRSLLIAASLCQDSCQLMI